MLRTRVTLAIVASGALLLSACGGGDDDGASGDGDGAQEITVAVAGPMTGENAVYGTDQRAGIEFAAKQINDAGGIAEGPLKGAMIKVEVFDDISDPNQGASVAQKICDNEDIMVVFGHSNSSVTLAAMPIYERCGVPMISSYSSNPEITAQLTPNIFRTIIDDAGMGAEMAYQIANQLGGENVGLIASPDDYGQGLLDAFEGVADDAGLTVAESIITTQGQKDYTPQLTSLRNKGVETVALLNTYIDASLQIKQAEAMGWDDVQFVVTTGSNTPELVKIAGKAASEGVIGQSLFDPNSTNPAVKEFVDGFKEVNGDAPGEATALGWGSFFPFLAAVEAGATDRDSVVKQMAEAGGWDDPIRGRVDFNENQGVSVNPDQATTGLFIIEDGEFHPHEG